MQKILWLDDDARSISYERDILVPDYFDVATITIIALDTIDELLEYLDKDNISKNDIFIIDIMLNDEYEISFPNEPIIIIPNKLMAGVTLYIEFLKHKYPNNPIILYTSREHSKNIFKHIEEDSRYEKTLFIIEKWKKDTDFIEVLRKLIKGL